MLFRAMTSLESRIPRCKGKIKGTGVRNVPFRSVKHFWTVSLGTQQCQSSVFLNVMKRLREEQQVACPTLVWYVGCRCDSFCVYSHTHTQKPGALFLALGDNLVCHG